jgi:hypothetical protein
MRLGKVCLRQLVLQILSSNIIIVQAAAEIKVRHCYKPRQAEQSCTLYNVSLPWVGYDI